MLRVVIPEYILGTALLIYNSTITSQQKIKINFDNMFIIYFVMILVIVFVGNEYQYGYKLEDYSNYQDLINYTNQNKKNVYLYTVPSLQFRYLAYSVYEMPPKESFSNLRVIGGWDMYTENYYDFKDRYNLSGNMLDLLKDNVYLIDGDVYWSGKRYENYKDNIALFIKENYDKEVEFKEIETFDNLKIYKVLEKNSNISR